MIVVIVGLILTLTLGHQNKKKGLIGVKKICRKRIWNKNCTNRVARERTDFQKIHNLIFFPLNFKEKF